MDVLIKTTAEAVISLLKKPNAEKIIIVYGGRVKTHSYEMHFFVHNVGAGLDPPAVQVYNLPPHWSF
ncbi:MAG: hypothetical protein NC203_07645 [Firmicutes bacterium]|nr:hypothetical protein [Bacillota bacterium]